MTEDLWNGLRHSARSRLAQRNYKRLSLAERLGTSGVEVSELLETCAPACQWIPGVEIFRRQVHCQEHRGFFAEMARRDEGRLAEIGFWPRQWATATMWAGTAKGFHIHPPFIEGGVAPEEWFQRLYVREAGNYALRPYDREQWDVMFFIHGTVELILVDERAGMERRIMRFRVDGDNRRGPNNAAVVIPAGVAHAMRTEGGENVVMVYGTSTVFTPAFEGRIESGVEKAELPQEWRDYLFE